MIVRIRSTTLELQHDPAAPFDRPRGTPGRLDLVSGRARAEELTRAIFFAERAATPPMTARARIIWRDWASRFANGLIWQSRDDADAVPQTHEGLSELGILLSGPATRGELWALDAYEALFVQLFSIGWSLATSANPLATTTRLDDGTGRGHGGPESLAMAWSALRGLWEEPWSARRRLDEAFATVARGIGR